jgi:hypothetical protein
MSISRGWRGGGSDVDAHRRAGVEREQFAVELQGIGFSVVKA